MNNASTDNPVSTPELTPDLKPELKPERVPDSTTRFTPDITAVISRLFVYPIKSCAGVEVKEALLLDTGLEFDRAWMVVDENGEFLTQRELPRMALVKPQLKYFEMVLRAPGMLALHIKLDEVESPCRVTVWDDEVPAFDMGPVAAQWFTDFLGQTARLVRFDPAHKRFSSRQWTGDADGLNQFSDGYPLLVISEASLKQFNDKLVAADSAAVGMERFRPSIVLGCNTARDTGANELLPHDEDRFELIQIATDQGTARIKPVKSCARCPIPNIDPLTALSDPAVGDLLQSYRKDARVGGAPTFGMNAIVLGTTDHLLKVGQSVQASYSFGRA